jgi:hypothetical protein
MSETATATRPALTVHMAVSLSTLVDGVIRGARARWVDDSAADGVSAGTLRHFTDAANSAAYTRTGQDIMTAYVRITTITGWEQWRPVPELLDMIAASTFVIDSED